MSITSLPQFEDLEAFDQSHICRQQSFVSLSNRRCACGADHVVNHLDPPAVNSINSLEKLLNSAHLRLHLRLGIRPDMMRFLLLARMGLENGSNDEIVKELAMLEVLTSEPGPEQGWLLIIFDLSGLRRRNCTPVQFP